MYYMMFILTVLILTLVTLVGRIVVDVIKERRMDSLSLVVLVMFSLSTAVVSGIFII